MRLNVLPSRFLSVGMALTLACPPVMATSHTELCRQIGDLAASLDLDTQIELVMSPCPEVSLKAMILAEELILADPELAEEWFDQDDEESLHLRDWTRLTHRLKQALHQGKVARARSLLDQAEVIMARDLEFTEEEAKEALDVAAIRNVLDGHGQVSGPLLIQAPGTSWIVERHIQKCGTGAAMRQMYGWTSSEPADAWLALNRPDTALTAHLSRNWVDYAAALDLPPRLRDFAEQALGPERANAEFEAALASIRIDSELLGRSASINLFGETLPLPVGEIVYPWTHTEADAAPETVHFSAPQMAERLRYAWQTSGVRGFIEQSGLGDQIELSQDN